MLTFIIILWGFHYYFFDALRCAYIEIRIFIDFIVARIAFWMTI